MIIDNEPNGSQQYVEEVIVMAIVNSLREISEANNIPQKKLSQDTGFSIRTISRVENGYTEPSAEFILRISKYFDKLVEEMLRIE